MTSINRRKAPRVPQHFMVRYRQSSNDSWEVTTLRDFSLGGAQLVCSQRFAPHTRLILRFGLPLFENPVDMECDVRWAHQSGNAIHAVLHGVAFPALTPPVRLRLQQAVEREQQRQNSARKQPRHIGPDARRTARRLVGNFVAHARTPKEPQWHVSTIRDISLGGARLVCPAVYELNTPLIVRLGPPVFLAEVQLEARIVRRMGTFTPGMSVATYGIAWGDLPPTVRQALAQAAGREEPAAESRELREQARVPSHLTVRYRMPGRSEWRPTTLRDLSLTGAQLICEEFVPKGEILELSLSLPVAEKPLVLRAHVQWHSEAFAKGSGLTRYGVGFEDLSPEAEALLRQSIGAQLKRRE